jgi:hypothetical protein
LGAEKQTVVGYPSRVVNPTSKSQSKSRFGAAKLEAASTTIVKALAVFKGALAESKGSACREPEQDNGHGGYGNANGEINVMQQPCLLILFAGRGAGNSC